MSTTRRLAFLLVIGLGGLAVLLSLGVWQLERHAWKQELKASLGGRLEAAPTQVTGDETAATHDYRAASATGRFPPEAAVIRYLTSIKGVGPGFRLISPFELESGRRILVDRGFAPEPLAPRGGDAPSPPDGPAALQGALRWPDEASSFTPEPNREDALWFARDVASMAAALETEPVLLVLSAPAAETGDWPRPQPVSLALPDNHFGYALTWFALAGVWVVMSGLFGFRKTR